MPAGQGEVVLAVFVHDLVVVGRDVDRALLGEGRVAKGKGFFLLDDALQLPQQVLVQLPPWLVLIDFGLL